jgi:hypothetical protein
MYWFREGGNLNLLPWLIAMLVAWVGGWLVATHAFKLNKGERLIVGLGLGIVLYTWLANLLGHWLSADATFYGAALVVLVAGLAFASRRKQGAWFNREDLRVWPWLLMGLALIWLFLRWSKGLALFDEHKNLSLISIIANGDIPPHFVPQTDIYFAYHYGFQIFAASLMRLGGMLPWSAFDTAKSVLWGVALLLAGLLGRRYIGRQWGAWGAAGVLALATGTRYLLLLMPPGFLLQADKLVQLQGTSALIAKPFSEALTSGWPIDGGPPMQYIFGFLSGIMEPFVMAHQGPNTLSVLVLLLVWLLLPKLAGRWSALLLSAIFAMWALTWETTYALFVIGLFLFAGIYYWRNHNLNLPDFKPVLAAAALSVPVALLQGGTLTEMARNLLFGAGAHLQTASAALGVELASISSFAPKLDLLGFSLRWPPAIVSSHLGALNLFSPVQLIVGLFEIGPVLLFTPWITRWAWHRAQAGDWALGVLIISAWAGFLIPIFFLYESDRDISRLNGQALLTWTLMLTFMVAERAFTWKPFVRQAGVAALAFMVFGGIVITGTQFSAATGTQLGDGFNKLDAAIAAQMWGRIPEDVRVFGPLGSTTILSGHLTGQLLDEATPDSAWDIILKAPTLQNLLKRHFDMVYIDSRWWDDLPAEMQAQASLDASCVETLAEVWDNSHVNFRRLLDLRGCVP